MKWEKNNINRVMMRALIIFFMICCVGCVRQASRYQFSLKGNMEGVKYGKVFLMTVGDSSKVLFSTDLDGGKFELKGELDEPGQFILKVNRRQIYFLMDGKDMEISCPYLSLNERFLKGSPANDLAIEYDEIAREGYYKKFNHLFGEYKSLLEAGDQKMADEKMTQALEMENKRFELTRDFVKLHPDNMFSAYISDVVRGESYEKGKELYDLLSSRIQNSYYGRLLKQHTDALAISALGVPCPDFTATDESGNKISMASQEGGVMVLDFWASWCGPCRQEMKNLREQYAEFKDRGVRFMSISLDDSEDKWKKACEEERIPWISVRDDNGWSKSEIRKLFGIQAIPFVVLLDKDGNIVAKNIRRNSLREKIMELLQK